MAPSMPMGPVEKHQVSNNRRAVPPALFGGDAMQNVFERLWKEEGGQDLTEYALLVVLVALGAVASMGSLSQAISQAFSSAATNLST
jgi:Flp pilus assembly pilin Flp